MALQTRTNWRKEVSSEIACEENLYQIVTSLVFTHRASMIEDSKQSGIKCVSLLAIFMLTVRNPKAFKLIFWSFVNIDNEVNKLASSKMRKLKS